MAPASLTIKIARAAAGDARSPHHEVNHERGDPEQVADGQCDPDSLAVPLRYEAKANEYRRRDPDQDLADLNFPRGQNPVDHAARCSLV
jgi:hypothetical protein